MFTLVVIARAVRICVRVRVSQSRKLFGSEGPWGPGQSPSPFPPRPNPLRASLGIPFTLCLNPAICSLLRASESVPYLSHSSPFLSLHR